MPRLHGYRERMTDGVSDKAVMAGAQEFHELRQSAIYTINRYRELQRTHLAMIKTFALIYKDLPKRPERRRTTLPCARVEVPAATLTRWQRFLRTVW